MRILVLRGGALGDFIVTLPALALLRDRWPAARLELVGNATAAVLALDRGLLDAAHSQHESRWAALYGSGPLPPDFAAWLGGFDLVLNFWPDPAGELRHRFPLREGQACLTADPHPVLKPAAAHYCAPLRQLGLTPGTLAFSLRTPAPVPRRVALHPGSGSVRKNWPPARWTALAQWMRDALGLDLLVISGEAESTDPLGGIGRPLRQRPLAEVADELAKCQLFIGHDSGVSHLAAATGARCLLLFGPTDPAMWGPPGPNVRVLQRDADLASISLAEVKQAVTSAMANF